jgi:hypothetical protein
VLLLLELNGQIPVFGDELDQVVEVLQVGQITHEAQWAEQRFGWGHRHEQHSIVEEVELFKMQAIIIDQIDVLNGADKLTVGARQLRQSLLKLVFDIIVELLFKQELFHLLIGFLHKFLHMQDRFLKVRIVRVVLLHVLEIVPEEELVLAEPLDGLDEVGVKGVGGFDVRFLE